MGKTPLAGRMGPPSSLVFPACAGGGGGGRPMKGGNLLPIPVHDGIGTLTPTCGRSVKIKFQ